MSLFRLFDHGGNFDKTQIGRQNILKNKFMANFMNMSCFNLKKKCYTGGEPISRAPAAEERKIFGEIIFSFKKLKARRRSK